MEEALGFDNILGENDILDMFSDTEETSQEEKETTVEKDSKEEEKEEDKTTEVVDPNDLFEEEEKQPESVGSGKDKEERERKAPPLKMVVALLQIKTSTLPLPTLWQRMESSLT